MGYTGGKIYQHGKRFYVQIYWNKQTEKFWSVLIQGQWHPIKSRENAEKLLCAIQEDIDRDQEGFDPRSFRPENPLALGAYCKAWLNQIDVSSKTRRDYKSAITKHAVSFFGTDKDIRKFRKAELLSFKKSLGGSDCRRHNIMAALHSMLKWAYQNEEIKNLPPFPRTTVTAPSEIEYLTLDQQEQILTHIPARDAPIFRFAMEYGLRIGEVRALKWDAIKDGRVYIRRAFSDNELRERTKTGDVRNPELTPYAQEIIKGLTCIGPFLFARQDGNPYTNKNLNRIWRRAGKASGIKIKLYNAVRHSLGCQLLDEGQDLSLVQEILGHKSQQMTRRYARRTAKRIGQILTMRRCGRDAVENDRKTVNKIT